MKRRSVIIRILAVSWLIATAALTPRLGTAQDDKVKAAMADLKNETEKLGAPKVEGKHLYFGTTNINESDVVNRVVKEHGGDATLFVKSGDQFVRVASTLTKDGSSVVGTVLDTTVPGLAKISNGEAYYGDATVLGKPYVSGYEPIKDASGVVIGGYWVGYRR